MMKRYLFFTVVVVGMIAACKSGEDFLDKTETTNLNEESVFADSARTMQFLTRIYSDIGFSVNPKRFGSSNGVYSICDEAEMAAVGGDQWNIRFQTGNISALQIPDDAWSTTYADIRRANVLLLHLPSTPLSSALKARVEGEARFLRAWYYFIMLKHYGGIPLVGDNVYGPTDEIPGKRNTFEECVNYIESECRAAADLLPPVRIGLDYGRITKGACLALRSRLLLYAASPLFNGRTNQPENLAGVLGYPTYDRQRWVKAADAAQDVISLGQYSLYEETSPAGHGFQKVFTLRVNSEYILQAMEGSNRTLESIWDPPSRTGTNGAFPYQEMVDAFGTINGKPITEDVKSGSNPTGYDAANPYVNRDPRLSYSILYNEGLRLNTSKTITPVYTYVGSGVDAYTTQNGSQTKTGYYIRKMLDENTIKSSSASPTTQRCLPLIRYAEILLNKAEALNEANDVPPQEVYDLLVQIRKRAGINPGTDNLYGLTAGMSQEAMRTVIQNERRVELAYEEHRYWDVRRWKIAENVSNKPLHGMKITKTGSTYTYELVNVRTPVFEAPKWYLWPIPQDEINKSPDLQQNPGW
ncbi:RagB/SusD family nutrient uptake outer membrane protein [Pedobacter sp. BS3]|nr:RagB/SusD family nutrient uptake outer membrane protein [Pedobacter sp. BS3]